MRQVPLRAGGRALRGNRRRRRGRPCPPHHGLPESPRSPGSPAGRTRCKPRPSSRAARSPAISSCCPTAPLSQAVPRDAGDRRRRASGCGGKSGCARLAVPGSIDVNIMSKGDRDVYRDGEKLPARFSDASAALARLRREHARRRRSSFRRASIRACTATPPSSTTSSPTTHGRLKKKIILKVSDFHSAAVQGKFLAKRGLWVSEYRIESGLNCGGHAFATKGLLLGPILEEFQQKKARTGRATARGLRARPCAQRGRTCRARRRTPSASRCKAASAPPTKTCCCASTTAPTAPAGPRRSCSCPR